MLQIIQQTREEKINMYMSLPKKRVVEMLVNATDIIDVLATSAIKISDKYSSEKITQHMLLESNLSGKNVIGTEIYY